MLISGTVIAEEGQGQQKPDMDEYYRELETFADAISLIKDSYVEPVSPKELIKGAMGGMLMSLDDYSQYLEPGDYKEVKEDIKGKFGGIGIQVGMRDGMLTIISPLDGTPASRAGLLPNDIIVKIDGELTKDLDTHGAVKKMRGDPGSKITVTIWREKEQKFFDLTMEREIVNVKSVKKSYIVYDNIGYIKLVEFQETSAKEIEDMLKELVGKNINGIILDLRNNAGGLLNSAIDVAEIFLKKGMAIVSIKGRIEVQNKEYKSARDTSYQDITLVVLVNEGSASASEIVSGAVKDNGRGLLVGKKTFGKGSVQTVVPLKDGSAMRLTTAQYFTPSGVCIHKKGIEPDINVDLIAENKDEKATKSDNVFGKLEPEKEKEEVVDSQLKAAIDVVKTINLTKAKKI